MQDRSTPRARTPRPPRPVAKWPSGDPPHQLPLPVTSPRDPGLMSRAQAARFLGISGSYLKALDLNGRGPRRVRLGRRSLYRPADLEAWALSHADGGTTDE